MNGALPKVYLGRHGEPSWTIALVAENLFLRRQLGLYKERGLKPRRVDAAVTDYLKRRQRMLKPCD